MDPMRIDLEDDGNPPGTSENNRGGGKATFAGCLVLSFILAMILGFIALWVMSFIGGVVYFFHQFM